MNNVENEIVTRSASGPWKFAFTWQGVGKDCIAPPKDCGAFQVVNAAITTIQTVLDSDLTESGVQNFFLSNDMNI